MPPLAEASKGLLREQWLNLNAALTFAPIVWQTNLPAMRPHAGHGINGRGRGMRSGVSSPLALTETGHGIQAFARRQAGRAAGLGLFAFVAFGLAALGTWNVADPSFSHATDNPVTNAMGYPGAVFADLAMQFFGLASVAALMPAVIWGVLFVTARGVDRMPKRGLVWFGSALLGAAIAGCVGAPPTWPLPTGLGGVFGDMVLKVPGLFIGGYPTGLIATVIGVLLIAPAIWLFAFGAGLLNRENGFAVVNPKPKPDMREQDFASFDDEDEDENEGVLALGAIATGGCRPGHGCAVAPPSGASWKATTCRRSSARAPGGRRPSASNRPSAPSSALRQAAAPASNLNSLPRWCRSGRFR